MFNVTVLKMRDIIKYFVGITLTICIVIYATKYFSNITSNTEEKNKVNINLNIFSKYSFTKCLEQTIPSMAYINEEYNEIEEKKEEVAESNYLQQILQTEISSIKGLEEVEKISKDEQYENKEDNETNNSGTQEENQTVESENIELAKTETVNTEVVTENPISESYNTQYGNVKIKNQTSYQLTEDMLKPDITIENKNILIFHTHSCESYTASEKYLYTPTGNFRTTDLNYTVTRVGTELANYLNKYNINVVHDTSYHDYPAYNGSYTRSLQTVENILETYSSDIIIDLHRDAIGSREDYAPTVKIGEDYAAQIMFVIGTNDGGLWHPNWNQNLKFAIKVQEKAEEMYPGLFKPIMLTNSRYNQHTGKFANIIEVGATGNTLEQCLTSMKYLSAVLNEIMQ
jgi:stage II sporulation protein P